MSVKIAETITVGSELTRGQSVDTHSALLARSLASAGISVRFQVSAGDVLADLAEAVRVALSRADLVIVTGGLGPTLDDLSREAIAQATGRALVEDAVVWGQIQAFFAARGRQATPNNRRQAQVLEGSVVIPNPNGTAPALRLELGAKVLFALPGPPQELVPLLETQVLPWLLQQRGEHLHTRRLQCYGLGESAVDEALEGLVAEGDSTSLAMLAKGGYVELILTGRDPEEARAQAQAEALETGVLERLGTHVYSLDGRGLEQVVGDLLKEEKATVAVAESCTGGRVAARLTAVPGSSAYFLGGFITYTNDLKEKLLGVPPFVIKRAGAVSKDTALAMAVGLARTLESDYSLAVTGIAGPDGGTQDKPVGLVHFALAGPEGIRSQVYHFGQGPREQIQARAAQAALWLLYSALVDLPEEEEGTDRGGYEKVGG
jgi:nicotinamide-nucleotide amidase